MTLAEAYASLRPILVEPRPGITRLAAALIIHPQSVAWADAGWDAIPSSGHPFHVLSGTVAGAGPWTCGAGRLRLATDADQVEQEIWADLSADEHRAARARCEPLLRDYLRDMLGQ